MPASWLAISICFVCLFVCLFHSHFVFCFEIHFKHSIYVYIQSGKMSTWIYLYIDLQWSGIEKKWNETKIKTGVTSTKCNADCIYGYYEYEQNRRRKLKNLLNTIIRKTQFIMHPNFQELRFILLPLFLFLSTAPPYYALLHKIFQITLAFYNAASCMNDIYIIIWSRAQTRKEFCVTAKRVEKTFSCSIRIEFHAVFTIKSVYFR